MESTQSECLRENLSSTTHLQLGDHVLLGVVRDALVGEQPSGQVLLVVALKHVLLLHEAEEDHGLVQDGLHLLLRQLHTGTGSGWPSMGGD